MRLLLLLFALLLQPADVPDDPEGIMTAAGSAYQAGEYARAIELYDDLTQQGIADAALYFNLGNAHYEAGQLGQALLWYRRAQRLAPRDDAINANIARVRAERVDFQGNASVLVDQIAESTYAVATRHELEALALVGWIVSFAAFALWLITARLRHRIRPWLIGVTVVAAFVLTVYGTRLYADASRPPAVVTSLSVEVMSGPGEDYMRLYTLYTGAEMRLLEQRDGWTRFILPDGRQGWVQLTNVEAI